jgi:hypothetical protein
MPGLGTIQRRILRAFIARPGVRLTAMELVRWCYPRRIEPIGIKRRLSARRGCYRC